MKRKPVPFVIDGEDRSFGGHDLYVDLVPRTCWGTAARTALRSRTEWDRIRKAVYARAGEACETCGHTRETLKAAGVAPRLIAHERYAYVEYPDEGRVQELRRLVCQCVLCDEFTHLGHTSTLGEPYYGRACRHAMAFNDWSRDQLAHHFNLVRDEWQERSQHEWALDPSLLVWAGGRLTDDGSVKGRRLIVEEFPPRDEGDAYDVDIHDPRQHDC